MAYCVMEGIIVTRAVRKKPAKSHNPLYSGMRGNKRDRGTIWVYDCSYV